MKSLPWIILLVVLAAAAAWSQQQQPVSGSAFVSDWNSVCVGGEAQLTNGQVTITLPSWFESRATSQGRTVSLTPKEGWSPLYAGPVSSGQFTVSTTSAGSSTQTFYWVVTARRP